MSGEEQPKRRPGRKAGRNDTERLANELGAKIRAGEWLPGHKLPSQDVLKSMHDVAVDVIQGMLKRLEGEGLIEMGQGSRAVVADREPIYSLDLNLYPGPAASSTALLSEPPLSFNRGRATGTPHRAWTDSPVAIPKSVARLLELEPDVDMLHRTMTLTIGGETVVTSTSYVPVELADDGSSWRDVEAGQLALTGHAVTPERCLVRSWMPDPAERKTFGVGFGVPVQVVAWPYRVPVGERVLRAGVIVTARGDRVFLQLCHNQPD